MKYLFLFLFIFSNIAIAESSTTSANLLSIYYAPYATVKGDLAEDDFIIDDDFSSLTLDPGTAKGIRWTYVSDYSYFIEYSSIKTESESGDITKDQYQALTIGTGFQGMIPINEYFDFYAGVFAGAGGSRFKFNHVKYRAHADFSGDVGILIGRRLSIAGGLKYQIIGYPSETMAEVFNVNISAGIWF